MVKETLSVIIPCRNEEQNIERCLNSVFKVLNNQDGLEVILVDGASTDNSVELAKKYPVNILQLGASWVHSAGAGRYIGCKYAKGKYIFIFECDMELVPGFMEQALEFMEKNIKAGGVAGLCHEFFVKDGAICGDRKTIYNRNQDNIEKTNHIGGAGLFRREAVLEAGNFNPYLLASEEWEFCQRLLKKKWELYTMPIQMTLHYSHSAESWELFRKHIMVDRYTGIGQVLRCSIRGGYFLDTLYWDRKNYLAVLFTCCYIIMALYGMFFNKIYLEISGWLLASIIFLFIIKKRSIIRGGLVLFKWIIRFIQIVKGALMRGHKPEDYPAAVKILKTVA